MIGQQRRKEEKKEKRRAGLEAEDDGGARGWRWCRLLKEKEKMDTNRGRRRIKTYTGEGEAHVKEKRGKDFWKAPLITKICNKSLKKSPPHKL